MADANAIVPFGKLGGTPVFYLHGAPGAPVEAELIASAAAAAGVAVLAIDRARVAPDNGVAGLINALARTVLEVDAGRRLPILGFSIGAALALRTAARLGADAGPLYLLSVAGPLDRPGAFEGMGTGRRVFRAAQKQDAAFRMLVAGQAALARRAPRLLARLLFAGADAADRAFAETPAGRDALPRILAGAWGDGGRSYRRDLLAYVEPWSHELGHISSHVELWHGLSDKWAPPAMARSLAEKLPRAALHEAAGGHYSTLVGRVAELFSRVGR